MITKFKIIKNLAVFQNFDWDSTLRDSGNNVITFSLINILYGRNYSGKTTLSRIMRAFETGNISDKYENPEFAITFDDSTTISQANLSGHNRKIRVFNEDFVRENLRFITNPDESILPFAILGGNAALELEIQALKDELGKKDEGLETGFYLDLKNCVEAKNIAQNSYQSAFSQLDNQLSQKATNKEFGIKYKSEKFGDQNYTKPKLENDIREIQKVSYNVINSEQEQYLLNLLLEKTNPEISFLPTPAIHFSDLAFETKNLVTKVIGDSNKIEQLVRDSILNKWVKEGKHLHEGKFEDCAFCGNKISEERWEELDKHFDEESQELERNILTLMDKIDLEIQILSNIKINKDEFYSKFHSKINRLINLQTEFFGNYISNLNNLKSQLTLRQDDLINTKSYNEVQDYSKRVIWIFGILENIRIAANDYSNSLSSEQDAAKITLRLKEVYDFVNTIRYVEECQNIDSLKLLFDDADAKLKVASRKIIQQNILIQDKERLMNDEEKGALKVNEYLNNFFGHDFLTLQAVEGTEIEGKQIKFEIIRNGKKAHHLSEGECSLIAFCYFMAKLEDIETKDSKPIIWIDDPISSLDSNHIFFVYSLINSEIVVKQSFEQLFLSTHSLDFLKYLKKLPGATHKNNSRYFIISREAEISKLKSMPKYLKDYVTEFNFLFHQIYLCSTANTDDDAQHYLFYNFANNTRKFLEAFLFYKYPNAIEHDDKLVRFFGNDGQAASMTDRINNEFSHLEGLFERSMMPVDIPEMKKTATFLLNKIEEKDSDQYDSLLKSIGIDNTPAANS